jgi:hypothetical protein
MILRERFPAVFLERPCVHIVYVKGTHYRSKSLQMLEGQTMAMNMHMKRHQFLFMIPSF